MKEIAAQTGGKAYMNQNDIKDGIALAASDEKASYSLGYYPENKKWDGKFRNIKVKVAQGDTQLRYRKGYFAIEPGPTQRTTTSSRTWPLLCRSMRQPRRFRSGRRPNRLIPERCG